MSLNLGAGIDVYPVGALKDLAHFVHHPDRPVARRSLGSALRYVVGQARVRNWRAVKNYFNGYLAEPRYPPAGFSRCGSGWTRGRAYRGLRRHLDDITKETGG